MPRQEHVLTVFVASPSDVSDERAKLEEVILELNTGWSRDLGLRLDLVRWETHAYPGMAKDAQDVINQQVGDDFDLFIGIMWCRYGTPTGRSGSGTAEEFSRAKVRHDANPDSIKIMMYFKDGPVSPSQLDPDQLAKVNEFRNSLGAEGALFWNFSDTDDFEKLVRLHLTRQVQAWKEQIRKGKPAVVPQETSGSADENYETDDDDGIFDLVDTFEARFRELRQIAERMGQATDELGTKVSGHVSEIESLPRDLRGEADRKDAKRLIARAAADMEHFSGRLNYELPLFKDAFNSGMDALIRGVSLMAEFGLDDQIENQAASLLTGIVNLQETLTGTQASMHGFRSSVAALPPMTSQMNRAKRKVLSSLDGLVGELSNQQVLLREAEVTVRNLIAGKGS